MRDTSKKLKLNIFKIITASALLLCLCSCGLSERSITISVDNSYHGKGDGSCDKPFTSLYEARDAVRQGIAEGKYGNADKIYIEIADGFYNIDSTLTLKKEDSGANGARIIYKARNTGKVVLTKGTRLPYDIFRKVSDPSVTERLNPASRDNIIVCDLGKTGIIDFFPPLGNYYEDNLMSPMLFSGDKDLHLAQWPDKGWTTFTTEKTPGGRNGHILEKKDSASYGSFYYDSERAKAWGTDGNAFVAGYLYHDWFFEYVKIKDYDAAEGVINLASSTAYGVGRGTWGLDYRRFRVINCLSELDTEGEWYLDRKNNMLYYYPIKDNDTPLFLVMDTEPLISMKDVSNVTLEGIHISYTLGDGIVMSNCHNNEIAGCTVSNIGGNGIIVDGSDNNIRSNDIFNIGKAGIYVYGGDRKSLTKGNNKVINNDIHKFGQIVRTYQPGVYLNGGCGNIVSHNYIHNAPHSAIIYKGNEHKIEYNEVSDVILETADAGALYTGRDWGSQGNAVKFNFIHDLGFVDTLHVLSKGIYLDDCDCGDSIMYNVLWNVPRALMMGGGRDNTFKGNLLVNCHIGLFMDARGVEWKEWNDPKYGHDGSWYFQGKVEAMNYQQSPWKDRYPHLANILNDQPRLPLYDTVQACVFINNREFTRFNPNLLPYLNKITFTDNMVFDTDGCHATMKDTLKTKGFKHVNGSSSKPVELGFNDMSNGDFTLKTNAPILKMCPQLKAIPFNEIGLYNDKYRKNPVYGTKRKHK